MAINFPTSLDAITNPSAAGGDTLLSVPHDAQHGTANDILEALEAKVGIDSSAVATSHDYKIANTLLKLDQTSAQTITNDSPIFDTLTASELVSTDASKKLQSLAVATYPSLTEISYIKGLSSAIQGQIDGKAASDQTMYIGSTQVAINRASATLNLAGIGTLGCGAITSTGALTATSYGGITEANLLDKSATEIITGDWTMGGVFNIAITDTRSLVDIYSDEVSSSFIRFFKANGTTASRTTVADGEQLGSISFKGYDGNSFEEATKIEMVVDGTVSDGVVSGAINFKTTNTSGASTLALKLDSSQNAVFAGTVGFNSEVDGGSETGNFTIDFSTAQKQKTTLTENVMTITLDTTNITVGNYVLKVVNGGLATITWAAESGSIKWATGAIPSLTSSGTDIITIYFDGTDFYAQASFDFS